MLPTDQTVTNRIDQARQAWLQGDGQAFANLFTADGDFIVPGQHWQGRAAILQAFQDFAATHTVRAIAIQNLVVQGHHAMLEWSWEDIDHQTGQVNSAADAIAIDFEGEFICRWREYIDDLASPAIAHREETSI